MNAREWLLSLGIEKLVRLLDENDKTLSDLVEDLTGHRPSSYGILDGGLMFNEDTWRILQTTEMNEGWWMNT